MRVWVSLNEDSGTARIRDLDTVRASENMYDVDCGSTGGILYPTLFLLSDESGAKTLVQTAYEIAAWARGRAGLRVDCITVLHGTMH